MKKRRLFWVIGSLLIGLILLGTGVRHVTADQVSEKRALGHTTVTLFFHGFGSSAHAEKYMVAAIRSAKKTNTVLHANVGYFGHVTITGKVVRHPQNPIVEVNYQNSRNGNYRQDGKWAGNVIKKLQQEYGMKRMNLVGHSMGNMDIMFYLLERKKNSPQLVHQVSLAGHYNGIVGYSQAARSPLGRDGKPPKMDTAYKTLLGVRQRYPRGVQVLNVYGNVGNGTDGEVANVSSRSLRYLLNNRAGNYREVMIKDASHSELHHNKQVNRLLISFLFN